MSMTSTYNNLHCVPKKVVHQTHGNNFVNSWRIFKILSQIRKVVGQHTEGIIWILLEIHFSF